jgi:hypothetical protein
MHHQRSPHFSFPTILHRYSNVLLEVQNWIYKTYMKKSSSNDGTEELGNLFKNEGNTIFISFLVKICTVTFISELTSFLTM